MAHYLQDMDIDRIKRQFLSIDKDGSGETSLYELRRILEDPMLQMEENDIAALITEYDINKSGTKEWDICEFLNMMSGRNNKELIHKAVILRSACLH